LQAKALGICACCSVLHGSPRRLLMGDHLAQARQRISLDNSSLEKVQRRDPSKVLSRPLDAVNEVASRSSTDSLSSSTSRKAGSGAAAAASVERAMASETCASAHLVGELKDTARACNASGPVRCAFAELSGTARRSTAPISDRPRRSMSETRLGMASFAKSGGVSNMALNSFLRRPKAPIAKATPSSCGSSSGVASCHESLAVHWASTDSCDKVAHRGEHRAPAPAPAATATRTLRILIAEDNKVNQLVVQKVLRRVVPTCEIEVVEDGEAALLSILERPAYDLVLMDIHMPRMDGLEAVRRVRERGFCPGEPRIVALTADTIHGRQRCMDAGMDDYVTKPFSVDDMRRILQQLT
jgi:CheY-like chemotaxis protein